MLCLLFLLWIVLNGKLNLEIILTGLAGAGLIYLFLTKVMGYRVEIEKKILLNVPWAFLYIGNLIKEIALASLSVMEVSFNRAVKPDPVIVEFHSGLPRNIQNVFLANSITLTPGTITVFQEGDFFVIHCLRREYAQGIENSSFIRLLQGMK